MSLRRILSFGLVWMGFFVYGQNKQLVYDFVEIPQSAMVNPGVETDFQWYAGVPLLSGISLQAGSSGISVDDIFADDGLDINDKIRDRAINGMNPRDELSGTFQVEFLNFGFRGRNPAHFFTGGIYLEGDAIGYWFKDYAILGFEGNADKLNQRFDLGHFKTRGELVNVFHFGVNKRIDSDLTIGGRAKVYSSIFDFNSTKNRGYFVTREGENNLLVSTLQADMALRTSGLNAIKDAYDEGNTAATVTKRAFLGGNLGLGFDFGLTYHLNEQTVFTASLLDLGFIYHTGDVRNFTLNGSSTIEGIEVVLPDAASDPNTDFWEDLVDEVEEFVPFEENGDSYVSFRPTKLYASLRYNFGETIRGRGYCECGPDPGAAANRNRYVNSVGGQLYAINRPRGPQTALSAFYQRRFGHLLALKATYTVDKFSLTNLGLGVNLQAGPVNFYVVADNLLAYRNLAASQYTSFQLGLNIISWGPR
ncbi:DUF5723 family protein [Pseudozobellia thermophila]|uniref:DUF5723 domain-containing protein n=1 Tax=Pseudozobellia thermophila TaxID=192903 RepID=A0A1M6LUR2_9FLAO|nr:DUF5723 family protein [Pseudozobellia thermophila]SHJ74977.1 hypothetical protein SAMN04488513_10860 [Pseudozobellia thermophila]